MRNLDVKFVDLDTRVIFVVVLNKTTGVIEKVASERY